MDAGSMDVEGQEVGAEGMVVGMATEDLGEVVALEEEAVLALEKEMVEQVVVMQELVGWALDGG